MISTQLRAKKEAKKEANHSMNSMHHASNQNDAVPSFFSGDEWHDPKLHEIHTAKSFASRLYDQVDDIIFQLWREVQSFTEALVCVS